MSFAMLQPVRHLHVLALCFLFITSPSVSSVMAQVTTSAAEGNEAITLFSNPTTLIVAQVDMQRMKLPANIQAAIAEDKGSGPLVDWLSTLTASLAPLANERLTLMVDVPFTAAQVPLRFIAKKPESLDLATLNENLATYRFSPAEVQGKYIATAAAGVLSESNKVLVSRELMASSPETWATAMDTVKDAPLRILLVPPAYLRSTYEDLMPRLPDRWGGTPTTTITEGIQWSAIGFDPASMSLKVVIQSKSPEAAHRLMAELPKLIKIATESEMLQRYKAALQSFQVDPPVINQDRIEVNFSTLQQLDVSTSVVMGLLSSILDPLNSREKQKNFRQLALALHNYESANKVLPPNKAARRQDGTSNLSWRVHILPYLDEGKLYSEFKLDEPWNSDHNIKLLEKMPDIYAGFPLPTLAPAARRGYTTIVAPTGKGTIFGGTKPVSFSEVQDGLSNTVFFVEVKAERAVPWTAPLDYDFPIANPADGLAIGPDGQFLCALGDGSVVLLPGNLPKETLVHLFQMNDGQVIELP